MLQNWSGSSSGGGSAWGSITGTLSAQTDLQTALDLKLNLSGGTMTGHLRMDAFNIFLDTSSLCYVRSSSLGVIVIGNTASNRAFTVGSQCSASGDLTNTLNGFYTLGDSTHRWKSVYTYAYTCSEAANTTGSAPTTMGVGTLVGGTLTVNNTGVTAISRIHLTIQDPNGGVPGAVYIASRVVSTSFTMTSTSVADTSIVAWILIEPV